MLESTGAGRLCGEALWRLACVSAFLALAAGSGGASAEALPGAPPLPEALQARLARELGTRGSDYLPRTRNLREDGSPRYTNRLLLETSPYLQQHAHNPVNWYPWGDAAFEDARRLERPVMISIGYSTCHWCHVMEEESFDDPALARVLNEHFIAIKVDREVRPDIDAIYMAAVHAMGQRGGWPLNVWVTPDRRPFYGGTYFPPTDRGGRPGFARVLQTLADQYAEDRAQVTETAGRVAAAIKRSLEGETPDATQVPDAQMLKASKAALAARSDRSWGGLKGRMKFPSSLPVRLLLRYHRRADDPEALQIAVLTLEKMAAGGIRDHVGGGFHRYATDSHWLVPHFEKMLYDNALLTLAYLDGWRVTKRADFADVTREILRYVQREMTAPEGGFYSATDADSANPEGEAEEGWFFTWTPSEIEAALGKQTARAVNAYYGVTQAGNFEGRNILHAWRDLGQVARELEVEKAELRATLDSARTRLYEVRSRRSAPLRDDKILVAWNGLMISAFAQVGFAFDDPSFVASAVAAADFVLTRMREDDRLVRAYRDGQTSGPAFLEDYAFLIAGLLDLYEAQPDPRWMREAIALQAELDTHYADPLGGYFKTAHDHEALLAREKPRRDGAVPSGNSVAALNLLRLYEFTGQGDYLERAGMLFSVFYETLARKPTALSEMLLALDYHLDLTKEVVVVRPATGGALGEMLAPLRSGFVPNRILSVVTEGADLEAHSAYVPLVRGKRARSGKVTAYVCENRVCDFPTSDPDKFAQQISRAKPLE